MEDVGGQPLCFYTKFIIFWLKILTRMTPSTEDDKHCEYLFIPKKYWRSEARPCLQICSSFLKESLYEMNLNICDPRGMIFCMCIASSKLEDPKFPYSKLFPLKCYLYISLLLEIMAAWAYLVNSHFWNIWK